MIKNIDNRFNKNKNMINNKMILNDCYALTLMLSDSGSLDRTNNSYWGHS